MSNTNICCLPATELASRIRAGQLSAEEVARALLDRISDANPALNAYVTICEAEALAAARAADGRSARGEPTGRLHGVPFSVKDLFHTRGLRTTFGSRVFESFEPADDSLPVARLRAAGGILLGKTNTPEMGYKATTENPLFGATRNPWALDRTPGGSSGGAAAAVASGMSPLALGSDGGGSIRIPASFCGVFGFKPSFGLVPTFPGFTGWRSLYHAGPIARTVADAALMMDVMSGPDELDRASVPCPERGFSGSLQNPTAKLRVGCSLDLGFARVEDAVAQCVQKSFRAIGGLGHAVDSAPLDLGAAPRMFQTLILAENAAACAGLREQDREAMDPALVKFVEMGRKIGTAEYLEAMRGRDELAGGLAEFFSAFDLLVTPSVAVSPFRIAEAPREIEGTKIDPLGWLPFTYPFNLTGNPAASVPCGFTADGLPVGMQVVGRRYADAQVLAFCAQFEQAYPWADQRPQL